MSNCWSATARLSWLVLYLSCSFLWHPAAYGQTSTYPTPDIIDPTLDEAELNQGITVFADTMLRENVYGTAIRADIGHMAVKNLSELNLVGPDGNDILTNKGRSIEVNIVMPKTLRDFEQEAFINTVKAMLEKRFGPRRIKITPLLIDVGLHEAEVAAANDEIEFIAESNTTNNPLLVSMSNAMIATNDRILALLKSWQSNFSLSLQRQLKDPEAKTLLFGSLIGSGSSISPVYFWLTQTGVNPLGIMQALLSIGYDQLNTRYSTKLVKFEAEHQFPFLKKNPIVRFYNGSTLLRAVAVNFAVNAGAGFSFRTMSYFADPDSVASPLSTDFLAELGGMNIVGAILTGGADIGVRTLRKKGYISQSTELIANSVFNFTTQMNNLLLASGFSEYLPVGLAIEWTAKSAVTILSRALPTKSNRFVILHSGITPSDREAAIYLNDLNETLKKADLSLPELRERIQTFSWKQAGIQKAKDFNQTVRTRTKELISEFKMQYYLGCNYLKHFRSR